MKEPAGRRCVPLDKMLDGLMRQALVQAHSASQEGQNSLEPGESHGRKTGIGSFHGHAGQPSFWTQLLVRARTRGTYGRSRWPAFAMRQAFRAGNLPAFRPRREKLLVPAGRVRRPERSLLFCEVRSTTRVR